MKRLAVALGTVASVLTIAGSAVAADLPVKAPAAVPVPPPVIYNWTGFYVGGNVGAAWLDSGARWDPLPSPTAFAVNVQAADLNDTSFIGGIHGGFNWQFAPQWVLGIEGDWSWTDLSDSQSAQWDIIDGPPAPSSQTTLATKFDWIATIRGRIGFLWTPQLLTYFTGGVSWGEADFTASATRQSNGYNAATSFSDTATGYVLGGGIEWMFLPNWIARAEYLYNHFDTSHTRIVDDASGNFPNFPSQFTWDDADVHIVRAGISYKFGP